MLVIWCNIGPVLVLTLSSTGKWGWVGHTPPPSPPPKKASSNFSHALRWDPQRKRKRGRPCTTWRRSTEATRQGYSWGELEVTTQNRQRSRTLKQPMLHQKPMGLVVVVQASSCTYATQVVTLSRLSLKHDDCLRWSSLLFSLSSVFAWLSFVAFTFSSRAFSLA